MSYKWCINFHFYVNIDFAYPKLFEIVADLIGISYFNINSGEKYSLKLVSLKE